MNSRETQEMNCNCIICKIKYRNSSWKRGLKDWSENDSRAFGILLVFLLFWLSFEQKNLAWIEEFCVNNIFHGYEHRPLSFFVVGCVFTYYVIIKLPQLFLKHFFTPYRYLIFPFVFVITYYYYRIQDHYTVQYQYFGISLLDALVFCVAMYILFAVVFNNSSNLGSGFKPEEGQFKFYHDRPLESNDIDELEFKNTSKDFFNKIKNTLSDRKESFSIGIRGVWGEGKSSFIFLLTKEFEKESDDFIVLRYNPRHAKSRDLIQLEFFQLLYDELKQYDFRFSSSFNNYLKAINVIDSTSIFDFLKQGHDAVFDKEDEKSKINNALTRINKRVVIFIDDLDRLLDDEIIEVFKLIDGNASFNNMLFITAYDREYVNKILEKYKHGTGDFIDKFFTVEKSLPYVPKSAYTNYLIRQLKKNFKDNVIDEQYNYVAVFSEKNLRTLRDCKRFLNRFIDDYKEKSRGVDFIDFFLLALIEYCWREYYEEIREMKVLHVGNPFNQSLNRDSNTIYISSNWKNTLNLSNESEEINGNTSNLLLNSSNKNFIELFERLFNKKRTNLSINNKAIFDNYFKPYINEFANPFLIEEMFTKSIQENRNLIDKIFENNQRIYIINYLSEKQLELLENQQTFNNYIDVLFYTFFLSNDYLLKSTIIKLLFENTFEILERVEIITDINKYKIFIGEKLLGKHPYYFTEIPYSLLLDDLNNINKENKIIFNDRELLDLIKKNLKDLIRHEPVFNIKHLELLSKCIINPNDSNENIHIDEEALEWVKKLIIENPQEYFNHFVTLEGVSSSPEVNSIIGKLLWAEIFRDRSLFKDFIFDSKYDGFQNINTVRNFWELYENNNHQPIRFVRHGNVQDKIDNGLIEEKAQLDRILELKEKFKDVEGKVLNTIEKIKESKETKVLVGFDFKEYILENDINYSEFLSGLHEIQRLIHVINKKDANGNDEYWLDIKILKDLKYYEVRTLDLYDTDLLPDVIKAVEEAMIEKTRKIKKSVIEKLETSAEFENICYSSLQPGLNRFDEAIILINETDISLDLDNDTFYFGNTVVKITGGMDSDDIKVVNVTASGDGKYHLNELGLVDSIGDIKLNEDLLWGE